MRRKISDSRHSLLILPVAATALAVASCATIGTPEGGPRDTTAPYVVRSNPPEGTLNFKGKRITLTLNKNVQLDDAFNKIVISPAQIQAPAVSSNGKTVTVELRDTLIPNTTYTIDFADAIKDLNEGNILDGFATDFSTGDTRDSLRISGMVVEARTLEPAAGMLVGVYSNQADSAIRTLPMERITKTNSLGQFTLRNLREGSYRIFALNDLNRDYHWDRSEDVAFYDLTLTPTAERIEYADTIATADGRDSIVTREVTRYLPNDILLAWFNENYTAQYIKEYARPERRSIKLQLGAPTDSMPRMRVVGGDLDGTDLIRQSVADYSATMDTLDLWIRDERLMAMDTLRVEVSVMMPDSLERLHWKADTLQFVYREPKKSKKQIKEEEEAARRAAEEAAADSVPAPAPPTEFISFSIEGGGNQDLNQPLRFRASQPLDTLIASGIRMEVKQDTLWLPAPAPDVRLEHANRPLGYVADYTWTPGTTYRLSVDSATVTGIYGLHNNASSREFTTKVPADYGTIYFKVTGTDSIPAIVELLDGSDKPVRSARVIDGTATFDYLNAGTYYARLFLDKDSTGIYGNGSLSGETPRQPDDVYYYPKKISLKKNWEMEQAWDINALPIDRQKPFDITKNKPKNATPPKEKDEEEESPLPPGVTAF